MKPFKKLNVPEWVTAGAAFIYYIIMALYKLTYAPIWQDEAMEFYCSVPVKGPIRGVTEYADMYERIAGIQQQPPLYNWIMCIWLQVSENEWWYRFSSVVMGFVAALGLYCVIRKMCSRYAAALSVIIFSSIYIIMYYIKEASEYAMLLMVMFWLIYVYMLICERAAANKLVIFTILCVLSVYTHYGAAFAVVPMAASVLMVLAMHKDWGKFKAMLCADIAVVLFFGIPLLLLFLMPQSKNPVSALSINQEIIIENGSLIGDFFFSIASVFRWCVLDIDRDTEKIGIIVDLLGIVIFAIIIFVVIKTKKKGIRPFFWCNVAVFMFYYIVTKLNLYAYGWYGNRYNMFIFPMWFVMITVALYEFVVIIRQSDRKIMLRAAAVIQCAMLAASVLYCMYGDYRVSCHWWKTDLRAIVDRWYKEEGYKAPTLVDYHQRYAFTYYFTHNALYDETQWENVSWNDDIAPDSADSVGVWQKYIYETYDGELPDELYFVTGQYNEFVEAFEKLGYDADDEVDTTAKLYHMVYNPDKPQILEIE